LSKINPKDGWIMNNVILKMASRPKHIRCLMFCNNYSNVFTRLHNL